MKGTRNTQAKTEILHLIQQSKGALSHAELQELLDGLCDRVTIYRVLERLLNEDKIHKAITTDGIVKYAACQSVEHHHHNHVHFNCIKCNTISCLNGVEPQIQLPSEYKVETSNFTLSGICPSCS
jgi:Fur family ferric uptake transcriptional regulator